MGDPQGVTGAGYALVDGNNFFVACERVFRPALAGRPVVVLSNNDGCVVSRSNEAKSLGVPMAAPWFKVRDLAQRNGIIALSANFELYGDMSARLMRLLSAYAPGQEVYSIDECFLDWSSIAPGDAVVLASRMRADVLRCRGLPCCVGIGPTKTLAKFANATAKKNPAFLRAGVCVPGALPEGERAGLLRDFPVAEVWGIGRKTAPVLAGMGIRTAGDLRDARPESLRARGGVSLVRIAEELAGRDCFRADPDEAPEPRQSILCSRSFGDCVRDVDTLVVAVAGFAAKVAGTLRGQGSVAGGLIAFAATDPHREDVPAHRLSATVSFPEPSDDTREIVAAATAAIRAEFRAGHGYKKAGVALFGIAPAAGRQPDLFGDTEKAARSAALMGAMDRINRMAGSSGLRVASELGREKTAGRAETRGPRYTTCWADIPVARAR